MYTVPSGYVRGVTTARMYTIHPNEMLSRRNCFFENDTSLAVDYPRVKKCSFVFVTNIWFLQVSSFLLFLARLNKRQLLKKNQIPPLHVVFTFFLCKRLRSGCTIFGPGVI